MSRASDRCLRGARSAVWRAVASTTVVLSLLGCPRGIRNLGVELADSTRYCCRKLADEPVTFRYLGAGGWLIRRGSEAVLTAPFYSNPGLLRVALGRIEPEVSRIERDLPAVEDVEVVLAGHSHYDHLMDLPVVNKRLGRNARIFGNETMVNILSADIGLDRLVDVSKDAGDSATPGRWWYAYQRRLRFMSLTSEHAPHFLGIKLFGGASDKPMSRLPTRASGWKEGKTLAFLIDFMSPTGEVDFRVHYQDAASAPPLGFPPPLEEIDGRGIDVAILCAASFDQVTRYPEGLITAFPPRHILLGHWEDFFTPPDAPVRTVRGTNIRKLLKRIPASMAWTLPRPGVTTSFKAPAP